MLPDKAAFQERLGALPLTTYKAGDTILTAGSKTGLLLILKSGKVAVIKDQVKIAEIAESGALFGELSALLDQPHAADVYASEASQFHVAGADALLKEDPIALLYVAAVLARRLDSANRTLVELKTQVQTGQPRSEIGQTIQKIETLLSPGGSDGPEKTRTRPASQMFKVKADQDFSDVWATCHLMVGRHLACLGRRPMGHSHIRCNSWPEDFFRNADSPGELGGGKSLRQDC